jgi:thymidylate kinase
MKCDELKIVSFSGVDGAGKSTQIDALCRYLEKQGYRFSLCTFWDDVVAFSSMRERLSLRVFRGDRGVGSPERPIVRRDKNVTSWHVVFFRFLLYVCDAVRLAVIVSRSTRGNTDVLVFDRYIYDELANLPLLYWPVRLYVRLLLRLVPRPEVALLLDADPEAAASRKPEYPLEFVRRNREAYLSISQMAAMVVLPPSSIAQTTEAIIQAISASLSDGAITKLEMRSPVPATSAKTQIG